MISILIFEEDTEKKYWCINIRKGKIEKIITRWNKNIDCEGKGSD